MLDLASSPQVLQRLLEDPKAACAVLETHGLERFGSEENRIPMLLFGHCKVPTNPSLSIAQRLF